LRTRDQASEAENIAIGPKIAAANKTMGITNRNIAGSLHAVQTARGAGRLLPTPLCAAGRRRAVARFPEIGRNGPVASDSQSEAPQIAQKARPYITM
jgi:hypothetical protein